MKCKFKFVYFTKIFFLTHFTLLTNAGLKCTSPHKNALNTNSANVK